MPNLHLHFRMISEILLILKFRYHSYSSMNECDTNYYTQIKDQVKKCHNKNISQKYCVFKKLENTD